MCICSKGVGRNQHTWPRAAKILAHFRHIFKAGLGRNSILYVECLRWVHKGGSGISGKLKSNVDFDCKRCLERIPSLTKRTSYGQTTPNFLKLLISHY